MEKHVIYTKIDGYVFYICYTKSKGAFVSSDAPDSEIVQFDEYDDAEKMAKRNSNETVTYLVKKIKI